MAPHGRYQLRPSMHYLRQIWSLEIDKDVHFFSGLRKKNDVIGIPFIVSDKQFPNSLETETTENYISAYIEQTKCLNMVNFNITKLLLTSRE